MGLHHFIEHYTHLWCYVYMNGSTTFCKGLREIGDKPADDVMDILLQDPQLSMKELYAFLTDFKGVVACPSVMIENFLSEQVDHYYSPKSAVRACDFFKKNQNAIGIVLTCYSLPYCYLGENGARVLTKSKRMHSDTYARLKETGHFLQVILNYDNWENKIAQTTILKVRLMHAMWRCKIKHDPTWKQEYGLPVNIEDMIGTNLSFSLLIIRGLRKMGITVDDQEEKAYLSHWNTVGKLLGIPAVYNLSHADEARKYDKHISNTQFRESAIGKELTKSLFDSVQKLTNNSLVHAYLNAQSRMLLGSKYADWLGIAENKMPNAVLTSINITSSIFFI